MRRLTPCPGNLHGDCGAEKAPPWRPWRDCSEERAGPKLCKDREAPNTRARKHQGRTEPPPPMRSCLPDRGVGSRDVAAPHTEEAQSLWAKPRPRRGPRHPKPSAQGSENPATPRPQSTSRSGPCAHRSTSAPGPKRPRGSPAGAPGGPDLRKPRTLGGLQKSGQPREGSGVPGSLGATAAAAAPGRGGRLRARPRSPR